MANESNLIPLGDRPERERKEIARKGAIASNKAQKEKKTIVNALKDLLQEEVMSKDKTGKMVGTGKTYQDLVNLGLLKGAMKGNASNYRVLLETLGQLQAQGVTAPEIKIEVVDNSNLEEVLYDNKE